MGHVHLERVHVGLIVVSRLLFREFCAEHAGCFPGGLAGHVIARTPVLVGTAFISTVLVGTVLVGTVLVSTALLAERALSR